MFELHSDLKRDGIALGSFPLSLVLLINDANYPWFVLVPQQPELRDLNDLLADEYIQFWSESRRFSNALVSLFKPDKLNVASLGNMTPQLHVHHVVRFKSDSAWPMPIWGRHPLKPYEPGQIAGVAQQLSSQNISGFEPFQLP